MAGLVAFLREAGPNALAFAVSATFFLHEMEEWNIHDYHRKMYADVPAEETRLGLRLWLVLLGGIGFLWAFIASSIGPNAIGSAFFMPFVAFSAMNGLQHLFLGIATRKYNPGLAFGGVAGLGAAGLYSAAVVVQGLLPVALAIALFAAAFLAAVVSMRGATGGRYPAALRRVAALSARLERFMSS